MKSYIYLLAIAHLLLLIGCGKTTPEPTPTEEKELEPTLAMPFAPSTLNGIGFMDIVFTADGRAAALSTRKEIFFSNDDGATWQLVRKYSTLNNDTTIQSLALHPTQDIIFAGAGFLHNGNAYLRQLIIKKEDGKWQNHVIISSRYIDQKSNPQYMPAGFTYKHSYWFKNYVISSLSNASEKDGFLSVQFDPEKTDDPKAQTIILPSSKNPFISKSVIPIYDGQLDKLFNCSGYEILPPNLEGSKRVHQLQNFTWMTFNSADNSGRPLCCIPDYMCASPDLSSNKFNKLMLYTSLGKLYHTQIRTAAYHQQEIILPKDVVGQGEKLCVGIDRNGHVWLGTATIGMFRSTTPLP